jgi:hypothetical protein
MTPAQSSVLGNLSSVLGGQIGQGVPTYSGELAPSAQPLQASSFNLINSLLSGGGLTGQASNTLSGIMEPWNPTAAQNTWQQEFVAPAMQNYTQNVLPAVKESFIGANAGNSGAADRAIAQSGSNLSTSLNSQLANMLYSGQQQATQNQLQAASQGTGLESMLASLGLSGGQAQYGVQSGLDTAAHQNWLSGQAYNNPWLNFLGTDLGAKAFEPVVQGPSSTQGSLAELLGGLGQFGRGYPGLSQMGSGIMNLFGGGSAGSGAAAGAGDLLDMATMFA